MAEIASEQISIGGATTEQPASGWLARSSNAILPQSLTHLLPVAKDTISPYTADLHVLGRRIAQLPVRLADALISAELPLQTCLNIKYIGELSIP
jgi:hypothetical protein